MACLRTPHGTILLYRRTKCNMREMKYGDGGGCGLNALCARGRAAPPCKVLWPRFAGKGKAFIGNSRPTRQPNVSTG